MALFYRAMYKPVNSLRHEVLLKAYNREIVVISHILCYISFEHIYHSDIHSGGSK